jgi:Family of unknown function (DUF5946)
MTAERVCPDCGARGLNQSCIQMFGELLALEYEHPAAFGAVHYLTVACFYLQHPRGFSDVARDTWRSFVGEFLDHQVTPGALLRRIRRQLDNNHVRIREPGQEPPQWWPRVWPVTVADAIPSPTEPRSPAGHIERVRRWAAAIRATIDTSEQMA